MSQTSNNAVLVLFCLIESLVNLKCFVIPVDLILTGVDFCIFAVINLHAFLPSGLTELSSFRVYQMYCLSKFVRANWRHEISTFELSKQNQKLFIAAMNCFHIYVYFLGWEPIGFLLWAVCLIFYTCIVA